MFKKFLALCLLTLIITVPALAQGQSQIYMKKVGPDSIVPIKSNYEFGSTANEWANGYFTNVTVSGHLLTNTATIAAGITGGDLNLDDNVLVGGTGTTSDLNFKATSGVGTTGSDIIFSGGNNGATEYMRILNDGNIGIDSTAPQSALTVNGGYAGKITEVDAATYTIAITDQTIAVDYTASGAVTLTLPAASTCFVSPTGCRFLIKDSGANAGTNAITINRAGADTIVDSATAQTDTLLQSDGSAIWIQAKDTSTWLVY